MTTANSFEVRDGLGFWWCIGDFSTAELRVGGRLQELGGKGMNMFYVIGAGVAVFLLVYLIAALVNAEKL
ncbi:hypothetical protein [Cellvibrio mixtus]|uniref:hypothetical protein n=1 Tax=Cellvibrio mixtus TaxID=39650 RepID=UPI000586F4C8|nr:hypothetical protein [Cellvibrio mixtus]